MSRCVVVAIRFCFSSSSFSSRSTPLHQHNTISMHQPSSPSSASSLTSRSSRAVYLLLIVSVCCTIGKPLHFTHSHVHSCLPSHAGSFDAPNPKTTHVRWPSVAHHEMPRSPSSLTRVTFAPSLHPDSSPATLAIGHSVNHMAPQSSCQACHKMLRS